MHWRYVCVGDSTLWKWIFKEGFESGGWILLYEMNDRNSSCIKLGKFPKQLSNYQFMMR